MMKTKFSLTAILGAAALTSGVLFANPATAEPCSLVKSWGKNFKSVNFNQLNPMQVGFLGIGGVAALAGAGWLVANKLKGATDSTSVSDDLFNETSFPIHIPPEALETTSLEVEEEEGSSYQPSSKG